MRSLTILISSLLVCFILFFGHALAQVSIPIKLDAEFYQLSYDAQQEVECLAHNIYFEAKSEPLEGQIAVAFVTLNRVKSGKYVNSICGVVKQKIGNVCQFSWWCETRQNNISRRKLLTTENDAVYNEVMNVALNFYLNNETMYDPTKGALFYHADYVRPGWKNMYRTAYIGRHIFYNRVRVS